MQSRGFSLIELMVTVAIVAILVAIGLPSFQSSMRSNRVATGTNELMASLSLARTEAIRSPGGAAICSTQNGTACGGDWNEGWMVWVDMDGDGQPTGADDRVLRYIQSKSKLDVQIAAPGGAAEAVTLRFDNRGRRIGQVRTLSVEPEDCRVGRELVRNLTLGATGQVTITKEACS